MHDAKHIRWSVWTLKTISDILNECCFWMFEQEHFQNFTRIRPPVETIWFLFGIQLIVYAWKMYDMQTLHDRGHPLVSGNISSW